MLGSEMYNFPGSLSWAPVLQLEQTLALLSKRIATSPPVVYLAVGVLSQGPLL